MVFVKNQLIDLRGRTIRCIHTAEVFLWKGGYTTMKHERDGTREKVAKIGAWGYSNNSTRDNKKPRLMPGIWYVNGEPRRDIKSPLDIKQ